MIDKVDNRDRRRFPRFNCNYPLMFLRYNDLDERKDKLVGKAINISLGGVKIKTSEIFPISELLDFKVKMERGDIQAKGRVIYKYIDSQGLSNIGVVFQEISPRDLEILAGSLHAILGR